MKDKVALEVAEQEFNRFVDQMDLDTDTSDMDEEERKEFEKLKKRIVSAIKSGSLTVNDAGEPTFTPQRTEADPLTFYEPTGATLMAMDRRKKNEDVTKMYVLMAQMTKTQANLFSKMKMPDLKVCQAVTSLFLA